MFISYLRFTFSWSIQFCMGFYGLQKKIQYKFDLFNFKDITKYLYIILIFISYIDNIY